MAEPAMPSRAVMQAETDRAVDYFRTARGKLTGDAGGFYLEMADAMAAQFREEFPGIPAGRVLVAAAFTLTAIAAGLKETGVGADLDVLVSITGLAGEQLDQETGR